MTMTTHENDVVEPRRVLEVWVTLPDGADDEIIRDVAYSMASEATEALGSAIEVTHIIRTAP